jgi:MarR family
MPKSGKADLPQPTAEDFQHLLASRVSLRCFQHWSETQARAAGLTHTQHQLLVAVKGHPGKLPPTVGDLAAYLLLRHHSAVELADRVEAAVSALAVREFMISCMDYVAATTGDLAGDQGSDAAGGTGDQGDTTLSQHASGTHLACSLCTVKLSDLFQAIATFCAHQVQIAAP